MIGPAAAPQLQPVSSEEELQAWVDVKNAVVPHEPTSVEELRPDEEGRLLLLARLDGVVVACGIARRSSFDGRGFVAVRVLPAFRRRGIGTTVMHALCDHVRTLGRHELMFLVDAADHGSIAFADRFGRAIDYRLQQIREVGVEEPAVAPEEIEVVALAGRREELLRALWPLALQAHADMPLPGDVTLDQDEWLRDEATLADGSFVALRRGELVGYAGLRSYPNDPAVAEHGLTAVRRDFRRRRIGYALKRTQLAWAAGAGIRELVTWTQKGNEPMQALNRRLGYVDQVRVLVYTGPLAADER